MIVENGLPPHLYILNKKDNSIALQHELIVTNTISDLKTVHYAVPQLPHHAQGTYLLPYLKRNSALPNTTRTGKKFGI